MPYKTLGFSIKISPFLRKSLPSGVFPSQKAPIGWLSGHVESYYNFLNSISRETETSPNFKDAAYVQEIMEAAYRSAESGTWVKI